MSVYTPWATSSISHPDHPITDESSYARDPYWQDDRDAGLVRLAVSLNAIGRQNAPPSNLPEFQDLFAAKRLPPLDSLSWTSTTPSDPSFHCHSLASKGPRLVSQENIMDNLSPPPSELGLYGQATQDLASYPKSNLSDLAGRPAPKLFQNLDNASNVSLTPSPPNFYSVPSYPSTGEIPRRSKAAIAVEDWDHPSFARPPHKAVEPKAKAAVTSWQHMNSSVLDVPHYLEPKDLKGGSESLVPESYPVPPPLPFEKSAAPFADLASEMVWERCFLPRPRLASLAPSFSESTWESPFALSMHRGSGLNYRPSSQSYAFTQPSDDSGSNTEWQSTANVFGVIGAEAKARKFIRGPHLADNWSLSCPNLVDLRRPGFGVRVEVKPAFRRWTRQVLEQTLLSPQVLVLALYYVNSVSGMDVFGDQNSKASLLPYKMLLAALVLANKTLDDHSYKNSTFANVSSMNNSEVNIIEVALLKALNFNLVPSSVQWYHWLEDISGMGERAGNKLAQECLSDQSHFGLNRFSCSNPKTFVSPDSNAKSIFDTCSTTSSFNPVEVFCGQAEADNSNNWRLLNSNRDNIHQNYWGNEDDRYRTFFKNSYANNFETMREPQMAFGVPGVGCNSGLLYAPRA